MPPNSGETRGSGSVARFDDFVGRIQDETNRDNPLVRNPKGHDGHALTFFDKMSGSAIHDDVAGSGITGLHVGFKTVPGSHRSDQNALSFPKARRLHQVDGNFNTPLVIDIGLHDHGPMELGLQLNALHVPTKRGMTAVVKR